MPRRPDVAALPENVACDIAGITPSKRKDWVKRGLVVQPRTKAKLTEMQVVQLAVVEALHESLGPRDAGVVWKELQQLLSDRIPVGALDVVVDLGYREVTLATDHAALAEAVRTGRAVCVVPLRQLVDRVREAFRRVASAPSGPADDTVVRRGREGRIVTSVR